MPLHLCKAQWRKTRMIAISCVLQANSNGPTDQQMDWLTKRLIELRTRYGYVRRIYQFIKTMKRFPRAPEKYFMLPSNGWDRRIGGDVFRNKFRLLRWDCNHLKPCSCVGGNLGCFWALVWSSGVICSPLGLHKGVELVQIKTTAIWFKQPLTIQRKLGHAEGFRMPQAFDLWPIWMFSLACFMIVDRMF